MLCKKYFFKPINESGLCDEREVNVSYNMCDGVSSNHTPDNVKSGTTYRERLVMLVVALGETLMENADSIVPNDTTLLSSLRIWSDLSHNDTVPYFDVTLDYCIKGSNEILASGR